MQKAVAPQSFAIVPVRSAHPGSHRALLTEWTEEAKDRSVAHTASSKHLGKMHMRLMTPQLVLSAVTSTLAAHNLHATNTTTIALPTAVLTAVVAIVCTVLSAISNFVEFNVASEKHSVAARRYEALYRHLSSMTMKTDDEVHLEVEMTALEFKHIADIAPLL